jgi:hypothetical protein
LTNVLCCCCCWRFSCSLLYNCFIFDLVGPLIFIDIISFFNPPIRIFVFYGVFVLSIVFTTIFVVGFIGCLVCFPVFLFNILGVGNFDFCFVPVFVGYFYSYVVIGYIISIIGIVCIIENCCLRTSTNCFASCLVRSVS